MRTTAELRKHLIKRIGSADHRLLRMMNALADSYDPDENDINEPDSDYEKILSQRLEYHKENPSDGKSWQEIKTTLKDRYGI
ncbi:MAG TPA: hypothetical protein DDZ96_08080 [Porphyromonadaceae bacterium]|jgi:hypothetical protein|uniref:hypothetical protein n=1 Tax=Limibacterium fermenti TaxID=3229863 RepID=UPI000E87AE32|nr:hypothetical protein [Porphyromonadaceae bacterium]HBK33002.1 hypothetical protein [Porphyromonadaceae bacterium]HBL33761.1 hypothetical protein [Porphyromonadaceae bacterium]HBX19824.1 hypothetical protein [Porphyromonadaceae bacterium]HBX47094.1 hypothetical protein [Porphyromonadaceae bacterium]